MAQVKHTVDVVYGSYSGTDTVICDENDEMDHIKAIVKKRNNLDFLSMCVFSVKITDTEYLEDENDW